MTTDVPGPPGDEPTQPGTTNNYHILFGQAPSPTPASPRQVAEQQLRHLQRRFARPGNLNDAYDTLEEHNIVFLDGAPGNGRTSAARVLLRELPRGTGIYHEIATVLEGRSPEILSPGLVGEEDRMLLDLSAVGEDLWKQYHDRLLGFHKILADKRAYLAVVLPHQYADQLSPDFTGYRRPVNRPDELDVVASRLRADGVTVGRPRPAPPALREYLGIHPPMRELARLADLILEARKALRPDSTFTDWCDLAITAQTARAEEVDSFVPGLRKGPQRALLLTVAMLHGAPADIVHRATALLQELLGIPQDDRPLLEHKGLTERLHKVGATRDDTTCVHFEKLRYDHAVRRHFWLNMPDLRDPLRQWVDQVLELPQLPDIDHRRLVVRFAELCLATDQDELFRTASAWAGKRGSRATVTYLRAAAELLRWGVENEETSQLFRTTIYSWSKNSITAGLRHVLIAVCAGVMSVHYPEQAVVRLHHLARREPPREPRARGVLLEFVAQDLRLQLYLLYRLFLFSPTNPRHKEFDARLFLDLVAVPTWPAHSFLRNPVTRDWLAGCWTAVFRHTDSVIWPPCVKQWIRAANSSDDPALVHHALSVLVDAAAGSYRALRQVYATARASLSAEEARLLLSRIHEAQRAGLSPRSKSQEGPQS
ncbi:MULTISPECIES: hypothetical protein [unclassified Streptomyces]|uniref:hypothetical protein n=1 Tax=unclassified Streptomyces TaxID=2593676 RepID=UPI0023660250|nr:MULTISPECIES: hypothetical protein [unclassified Streptomyces]MDF3141983.1 hypothetical protein [Streptomyces sp. T21Q-yed]WDF36681.1 hypothetical protein PBV52_07810 [Streptomyces sp. T12]